MQADISQTKDKREFEFYDVLLLLNINLCTIQKHMFKSKTRFHLCPESPRLTKINLEGSYIVLELYVFHARVLFPHRYEKSGVSPRYNFRKLHYCLSQ